MCSEVGVLCAEFWTRAIAILASMFAAGILGAYCRVIWDQRRATSDYNDWLWPGMAAALVVPLFLSVGGKSVFSEMLSAPAAAAMMQPLFVVVGFCVLAGASASSFVNALAQKALSTAREAERKAERAETISEVASEPVENADEPAQDQPSEESLRRISQLTDGSQKAVYEALVYSKYDWRTFGGIVKATGLQAMEVRSALTELIERGFVITKKSARTGSALYQAPL